MNNLPIDVIHEATQVVLSAYTYTQVYATGTTTVVINGNTVKIEGGSTTPIIIRSISSTPGVFCLGTNTSSLSDPDPNLGQYLGGSSFK